MNDDLFGRDYDDEPTPPGRDNLFLWTVFILLLIGLALTCWLGSFYIFGHPEKPDSYRILQKLHKLDPPKRFELTKAPPGEFLTPQKAFERYSTMSRFDLGRENEMLLRDYIKNFQSTKRLVPYITGRYSIMNAAELKSSDFFGSGVVALAQSVDFPQVVIEHVYTAGPQAIPVLDQMLATGLDIKLEKTMDLSAIIHVARMPDGRLQFTVVPLLYGSYALKQGSGSFGLEPPAILNPAGGLPIVRGPLLEESIKSYTEYTRKRGGQSFAASMAAAGGTPAIPVAQPAAETTIVRVATPAPAPTEEPAPTPRVATETPRELPAATPAADLPKTAEATPAPTIAPRATPVPLTRPFLTPVPAPEVAAATPRPVPSATPSPETTPPSIAAATPARTPHLQPFLVSSPTPGVTSNTGASWRTYAPGQMPRGRLVNLSQANELVDRGTGGERLYLHGNFTVTASNDNPNRAVLRSNSTFGSVLGSVTKQPQTRVIVEFPAGMRPPAERSTVSRDENRPFEVRDIRRGADGQINIYVREVTEP